MNIEFLFFEGCPNSEATFKNLIQSLKELGIKEEPKKIEVKDLEDSKKFKFMGSPSIYINGIDIYTEDYPSVISYSCRTYNIDGKITGILPKDFITKKLQKIMKI